MLLQLRDYIRQQKVVSDQQIAREFRLDLLALQPMLDVWLRKGVISTCEDKAACKTSCFKCASRQSPIYYRYQSSFCRVALARDVT